MQISLRSRPYGLAVRALGLAAIMLGLLSSCTFEGLGNKETARPLVQLIRKESLALYDRFGPVILSSQGFRNFVAFNLLTHPENDPNRLQLQEQVQRLLTDDAYAESFAVTVLKDQYEKYPGDGTFLGQWGIKQDDETLHAFVRSQIKPVGDTPSHDGEAWLRDSVIKPLLDNYKVDYQNNQDIRDILGPELTPATPGLGS